jgi:hypothetical protein
VKPGFYWVKGVGCDWTIGRARYDKGWNNEPILYWTLVGSDEEWAPEDFEHIGSRIKGQPDEPSLALDEVL